MVTTIDPVPIIARTLSDIEDRKRMSAGIAVMSTRRGDFSSELEMKLTGVAMVPDARNLLNDAMTTLWSNQGVPYITDETEVIIGGGYAAAVYSACRYAQGYRRPVVLEKSDAAHVGGTFALSGITPAWYLNSENRGGMPGQPADGDALNYLPGGILQVSMVSAGEYPTNADMALVIRLSLAQFADVYPRTEVMGITENNAITFRTEGGPDRVMRAGRVLDMTGIGRPRNASKADNDRILTFDQFMARQASDFPLQGWDRVAIVGGGDGGKCVAETLLGIGPAASMSVKGLDQPSRIGWYAAEGLPLTTEAWRTQDVTIPGERVRTRYMRLGSYLPSGLDTSISHDLTVIPARGQVTRAGDLVLVNGKAYDHAVLAQGYSQKTIAESFSNEFVIINGLRVGRQQAYAQYKAGVAADLPFQSIERDYQEISANQVAMFRQGPRIATLASTLGEIGSDPVAFG